MISIYVCRKLYIMKYSFEILEKRHSNAVMEIFNYYVENSFAAYPEKRVPPQFFDLLIEKLSNFPAYAIINHDGGVVGFCILKQYLPFSTFKECAEISYFIHPSEVAKGAGKQALDLLEAKGSEMGVKQILANISSLNEQSLAFHSKNGFKECGRFKNIITKNGVCFDIVWMQKEINSKL